MVIKVKEKITHNNDGEGNIQKRKKEELKIRNKELAEKEMMKIK